MPSTNTNKIDSTLKLKIAISLCLILVVTLIPMNGTLAGNHVDKIVHLLIFVPLSFYLSQVFHDTKLITLLFGVILLGFITEFLQQFVPGRNLEFYDALADTIGVMSGYYLSVMRNNKSA